MGKITKKYQQVIEKMKLLQIMEQAISDEILKAMEGRESFTDTDKTLNEKIYQGTVFSDMLDNVRDGQLQLREKFLPQLNELEKLARKYEYIMIRMI